METVRQIDLARINRLATVYENEKLMELIKIYNNNPGDLTPSKRYLVEHDIIAIGKLKSIELAIYLEKERFYIGPKELSADIREEFHIPKEALLFEGVSIHSIIESFRKFLKYEKGRTSPLESALEQGFVIAYQELLTNDHMEYILYNKETNAIMHFELDIDPNLLQKNTLAHSESDVDPKLPQKYNRCTNKLVWVPRENNTITDLFFTDHIIKDLSKRERNDWPSIGMLDEHSFYSTEDEINAYSHNNNYKLSEDKEGLFKLVRTVQKIMSSAILRETFGLNNMLVSERMLSRFGLTAFDALDNINPKER